MRSVCSSFDCKEACASTTDEGVGSDLVRLFSGLCQEVMKFRYLFLVFSSPLLLLLLLLVDGVVVVFPVVVVSLAIVVPLVGKLVR